MTHDPTRCGSVVDRLADLLYGELEESSEREIRSHLDGCEACRERFADLQRLRAVMRSAPRIDLPSGLEARVMSEARAALPAKKPEREPEHRRGLGSFLETFLAPGFLRPALAAALTIVLVVGVAWLLNERKGSVVERYAERPEQRLGPTIEAPAAAPDRTAEEAVAPAPPPYPSTYAAAGEQGERDEGAPTVPPGEEKGPWRSEAKKAPDSSLPVDDKDTKGLAKAAGAEGEASSADDLSAVMGGEKAANVLDEKKDETTVGLGGGMVAPTSVATKGEKPLGGASGESAKTSPPAKEQAPAPVAAQEPGAGAKPSPGPAGAPPAPAAYAPPAEMGMAEVGSTGVDSASDTEKESSKKKKGKAAEESPAPAAKTPSPATPAKTAPDPFDSAIAKKQAKDYGGAIAILKSLRKDPSSTKASPARILHELALCTAAAGDPDRALVYYENLIASHPTYSGAYQAMWEAANLYIEAGDKKRARALLEKLLGAAEWKSKAEKKLKKID